MSGRVASKPAWGVFGISGVGKSTLAAGFALERPGYLHVEASVLIKSKLADARVSSEALRTMPADRIVANQRLLVDAFKAVRSAHPDKIVLLDAHSVIEGDKELVRLPSDVIGDLRLQRIVVVVDAAEEIVRRRLLDIGRRRPKRTVGEIDVIQNESTGQCRRYSSELGIPLDLVRAGDADGFARVMADR